MKKIYLVVALWAITLVVGIVASVFNLFGLTFLVIMIGIAAAASSFVYVAENWDNWK